MPKVKKSDLPIEDKIALAAVAVLGKGVAKVAYLMAHPSATKNKSSQGVLVSRWLHSDLAVDFMQRVTTGTATVNTPDEANDLTTRGGIISELITSVKASTGKEAISGLQSLAKLQGFDKPDEINEEDKRFFVLPYLSNCRSCKLMQVYMQIQKKNE